MAESILIESVISKTSAYAIAKPCWSLLDLDHLDRLPASETAQVFSNCDLHAN
jgi:hypothetical protein